MIRVHCCLLKLHCGTAHLSRCLVVAEELNMKAEALVHCSFHSERVSAHVFHLTEQKFSLFQLWAVLGPLYFTS